MKRFSKTLTASALVFALACSSLTNASTVEAASKVTIKKVTVKAPSGKTCILAKGKSVSLTATVSGSPKKTVAKKYQAVTYKSADTKIASVTKKGLVKGRKVGKTTIKVTSKKNKKKSASIKVIVKKNPVKKITLKTKSASLSVGETANIKASISPSKQVSKKLSYKSSNKKVATVSAKGKVTAKGEGSAKITVSATDGSKKKAVFNVKVGIGIQSVKVTGPESLLVTLSAPKNLARTDFTIHTGSKEYGFSHLWEDYQAKSYDGGKTYEISLNDAYTSLYPNEYVKISIPKLSIDNEKEEIVSFSDISDCKSNDRNSYVKSCVGEKYSSRWYIDDSVPMTYEITSLPAGLKAYFSEDKAELVVRGQFTSICNGASTILTGTDAKGNVYHRTYYFYVGSDTQVVAKPITCEVEKYRPSTETESAYGDHYIFLSDYLSISGPSYSENDYTYSSTDLPSIFKMTDDGLVTYVNDENVVPGNYSFHLTLTYKEENSYSTTIPVTITVCDTVKITGVLRDADGIGIPNAYVSFVSKYDSNGRCYYHGCYTDANGYYSAYVIPAQYKIASRGVIRIITVTSGGNVDLYSPYHLVKFVTDDMSQASRVSLDSSITLEKGYTNGYNLSTFKQWNNESKSYEATNYLYAYLLPGTYDITSYTSESDRTYTCYDANGKILGESYLNAQSFTVTGNQTITLSRTAYALS